MASERDRNPSPPPELMQNDEHFLPDKVGDSVYSKHGVFQILMHIIESLDRTQVPNTRPETDEFADNLNYAIAELDPKLEDEVCLLWDMSASFSVANLLHEYKASAILLDVVNKTNCPRLAELLIGILGNMFSFDNICEDLSKEMCIVYNVVEFASASDAPTVVQVLRLIHTAVVNPNSRSDWMEILSSDTFLETMKYLLRNSLNCDVLKWGLKMMYYVFDEDETTCAVYEKDDYTKALLCCAYQLTIMEEHDGMDEFWLVLDILCQYEANATAFANNYKPLGQVIHSYFMRFGDHDDVMPEPDRAISVAACFSTYATIWKSGLVDPSYLTEELNLLGILHKMYVSLVELLSKPPKTESDPSNVEMGSLAKSQEESKTEENQNGEENKTAEETVSEAVSENDSERELTASEIAEEERKNWLILLEAMRSAVISLSLYVDPEDSNGKLLLSLLDMNPTPLPSP